MVSRRKALCLTASYPLLALPGCGGGGKSKSSSDAPPLTIAPTTAYVVTDNYVAGKRVISGESENSTINLSTSVHGGVWTLEEMTWNSGESNMAATFENNLPKSAIGADGRKYTFQYTANEIICRQTDRNGNFEKLWVSFIDAQGKVMNGVSSNPTYAGPASLTEISDVTTSANEIMATLEQAAQKQASVYPRLLDLIIPSAYAQELGEFDLNNIKKDILKTLRANIGKILLGGAGIAALLSKAFANFAGGVARVVIADIIALLSAELFIPVVIGLIALALIVAYCQSAKATTISPLTIAGRFSGDDSGPFGITVAPSLILRGAGYSNDDKSNFTISGALTSAGGVTMSAGGGASTGATFGGTLIGTQLRGTWINVPDKMSGSFYGYITPRTLA